MAQLENTSSVEKKFKDVFERSPGAFPEGTSLEEKVNYIAKGTKTIKAIKDKELEGKMKNVAELSKELESRKSHVAEKVRQDFERIAELDRQYKGKGIFRREKIVGPKSDKELQGTPKKPTAEGKSFEQSGQKETSVQTDVQLSVDSEAQILSEPKSQVYSISRSPTREKSNDRKSGLNKEDNVPQENQKEEGLLSLLGRFLKKILEKFLGEDNKSVKDMKGYAQKNTSSNEVQEKNELFDNILSQDQSISEGLKQETKLDDPSVTHINTPEVEKTNAGRGR